MTEEEKRAEEKAQKEALLVEIQDNVKSLIDKSQEGNIKKEDLDAKVEELNKAIKEGLDNEGMAALKTSVEGLVTASSENTAAIKAMTEKATETTAESPKSFREAIKTAILGKKDSVLTEKNDDYGKRYSLKDYFTEKGNKQTPVFTIKAGVDMLESTIAQPEVPNIRLTDLDPNRVGTPLAVYPNVLDWMPSRGISRPYMSVLVVYDYQDGAGTKTEGSAPGQSSFLFKTIQFPSFFIATYFTLSDETLDDLDEAMDEISIVAPEKINDNVDSQILGAAGDDVTALAGILTATKNTAFVPATYTSQVKGANIIDVIAKMKLSCLANKYRPDTVLLNPDDIDNIAALKDGLDNSILDRRMRFDSIGNPTSIAGMRIIASTTIVQDTAIVLDSTKTVIGKRRDMTLEIGYNGTDFTEGQKTVIIKIRVAFAVRDKAGVIYSDGLAAAKDVIDATV